MSITIKDLENRVNYLNRITNSPNESYSKDNKANIGNFYLSGAYGGYQLERICNSSGGCDVVLSTGYVSKKELYYAVNNFINGINFKK